MDSILKGISIDVSFVGIYFLTCRWVLGVLVSYWCAGGNGPRCDGDVVGDGVSIVPPGELRDVEVGGLCPEKGWYPCPAQWGTLFCA
jgi:hypothetical protein